MAEAILNPDGERYFSFNSTWSETEELASMRNGSGDEYDIVFAPTGAYIRGFDHESPLTPYRHHDVPEPWPGVLDSVPKIFQHYVQEPAFVDEQGTPVVTVCLWRELEDDTWKAGEIAFPEGHEDPDGSNYLFELLLSPTPEAYHSFAEDYYERTIDIEAVRDLYALRPLDASLITRLNASASIKDAIEAAEEIGYPMADGRLPHTA
ncbi:MULTISPECIES: hypothetical protein [Streptomyces]|nr:MULTISPECIES: hypothetical protein [Streptomyces]